MLRRALQAHSDTDAVLFCGDGTADIISLAEQIAPKQLIAVQGNCDPAETTLPMLASTCFGPFRTAILHGHTHEVKQTDSKLLKLAQEGPYQLIIYGHTHVPRSDYIPGTRPLYLFNPGSIRSGCYGLITIQKDQILLSHAKITSALK